MNITITITNPTVNVLAALAEAHAADNAKMMESLDNASTALDVLLDEIAKAKAQPEQAPSAAPVQDAPIIPALRIASVADIGKYLDIGTEVHWRGQKFVFSGVVEKINDEMLEVDDIWDADEKILFIRRNARPHEVDTSRVVKLNTIRAALVTATTIPATFPKFYPADQETNFVRKVNALMTAAGV